MWKCSIIIVTSSAVHFVLTFALFFYALSAGIGPPKQHQEESLLLVDAASKGFEILSQPGWIALRLNSGHNSLLFELLVFAANSLLWGCGILCVFESALAFLGITKKAMGIRAKEIKETNPDAAIR